MDLDEIAVGSGEAVPDGHRAGPNFIIGGAPKCGTTSLHFILGQQPDIGIPDDEVNYFDADDPIIHPDYFFAEGRGFRWYDPRADHAENRDWYLSRFTRFGNCRLWGEDSTLYLFSEVAPHRIKERLPDAKIIFMLRDPVRRAYSQYWHEMKMMRVTCSFERALTRFPTLVRGSTYAPNLKRWQDILGPDRIHVILFEDFLTNKQGELDRVADFIGLPRFDAADFDGWFNKTYYPINVTGQKILNLAGQFVALQRYRSHMGFKGGFKEKWANKVYQKWFHKINPLLLRSESYPPMEEATKRFLTQHLRARNHGLSELLGRDLTEIWPSFRE